MPSTTPPSPVNPFKKATAASSRAMVTAILAILLAISASIFAGLIWKQYDDVNKHVINTSQQLKKQTEDSRLQLQASVHLIKAQTKQLQENLTAVQSNLTHIIRMTTKSSTQRTLGDVTYLIHLANLHLTVGHDASTALQLLEIAYQRLQKVPNPAVFALKQALIHDIAALKLIPKINVSDIVLRLDQVSQAIQNLPELPTKKLHQQDMITVTKPEHDKLPWHKRLIHSLSGLKDLVVIRHIQKPIQPLLSPEQQSFLLENIQLKISQAGWAVLHQDPKLYRQSLEIAQDWLKNYYRDQTAAADVLKNLRELANINVKPKLPTISDSLNALSQSIITPHTNNSSRNTKKKSGTSNAPKQPEAKP